MRGRTFAGLALLVFLAACAGRRGRDWSSSREARAGTTAAERAAAPAEEVLVYSKPYAGVYVKEGGRTKRVVLRHGGELLPRLSPDGGRLLVNVMSVGKREVWVGGLEGKDLERVCEGDEGAWSPDGGKIAFRRGGRIMERDLTTGEERAVTPAGWADCGYPAYCGERSMVFVRGRGPEAKLYLAGR